jgi:[ribosomal protein S5]-alanine N-acetyltransferase
MIETERLILKPLTYEQLLKYIKADNSLETELNLSKAHRIIQPDLLEALEESILPRVENENSNYLFSTLWTLILKEKKQMIGDLCFMGEPNLDGELEIGYGTYSEFQRKGYMTEAVGGIIKWAANQPKVISVLASTEKINVASYNVLQKNNFIKFDETGTMYFWKLKIN